MIESKKNCGASPLIRKLAPQMNLLCPRWGEFLRGAVSTFSGTREFDLIAGNRPFIQVLYLVTIEVGDHCERDVISSDLSVGNWKVSLHSRNRPGQLGSLDLEGEGLLTGLTALSLNRSSPLTTNVCRIR